MTPTQPAQSAPAFASALTDFSRRYRQSALPAEALRRSLDAITDTIGCSVLGARQELEAPLRRVLFGNRADASRLEQLLAAHTLADAGTETQGSAALYIGTLAHAADFDDISHPAYCHATALLLPGLLVRAAVTGATGLELMRAHVFGMEVLGQLGRRLNTGHYQRGWHTTGTFGAVAATAALCHLENFSDEDTHQALGISASLACGLRQNFGTMTKPLHAGLAARSAILATRLAAEQFNSAGSEALDGKLGFMQVFGGAAEEQHRKSWGEPLEILTETGIGLKAYPCCAATHPAIDAAKSLRHIIEQSGTWCDDEVESVYVAASRYAMDPLIYDNPQTSLEAKFSMRYCVAAALHDGQVNMDSFLTDHVQRPAVRTLMQRIRVAIDERVAEDHEFAAILELQLKSGRRESVRIDIASGKPGNWLADEVLKAKFFDCLGVTGEAASGQQLFDHSRALAGAQSVSDLTDALARSCARAATGAS